MLTMIVLLLVLGRCFHSPFYRPWGMFWGGPFGYRRPPMGGMGFGPHMGMRRGHGPFMGPRGWF